MPTVHLLIKGKVQGVFFRATAQEEAGKLQLNGWVKNTREGDVEILADGSSEALEKFISWCHKGPPKAIVTQVQVENSTESVEKGFRILRY